MYFSRGIIRTQATSRLVFAIMRCRAGSYAALPQLTPPTLEGTTTVPFRLGGVKIPSVRMAHVLSAHQAESAGVALHTSSGPKCSGTSEMVENGWVGDVLSPGMSVRGTARSSTGTS